MRKETAMNRSFFEDDEDLGVQGPSRSGSAPAPDFGGGYGGGHFRDDGERVYEGARIFDAHRHPGARPQPSQGWAGSAVSEHAPASARPVAGRLPKHYVRPDTRVREDVCERLSHRHDLDLTDVEVEVQDRVVRLAGSVTDRAMKHRIEDVAAACLGVEDVDNRLRVRRAPGADTVEAGRRA
jgi:hypothetical protein